jgi:hypothetical protein
MLIYVKSIKKIKNNIFLIYVNFMLNYVKIIKKIKNNIFLIYVKIIKKIKKFFF